MATVVIDSASYQNGKVQAIATITDGVDVSKRQVSFPMDAVAAWRQAKGLSQSDAISAILKVPFTGDTVTVAGSLLTAIGLEVTTYEQVHKTVGGPRGGSPSGSPVSDRSVEGRAPKPPGVADSSRSVPAGGIRRVVARKRFDRGAATASGGSVPEPQPGS